MAIRPSCPDAIRPASDVIVAAALAQAHRRQKPAPASSRPARRPVRYCRERWIDLAIVVLPMLEFALTAVADAAPIARLLRLTRAAAPEQLARMGQMYRLRGLLTKGWRAILMLRLLAKLTGSTPEKQLRKLEEQIAEAEASLAELKAQAEALRRQCQPAGAEGQKVEAE